MKYQGTQKEQSPEGWGVAENEQPIECTCMHVHITWGPNHPYIVWALHSMFNLQ